MDIWKCQCILFGFDRKGAIKTVIPDVFATENSNVLHFWMYLRVWMYLINDKTSYRLFGVHLLSDGIFTISTICKAF